MRQASSQPRQLAILQMHASAGPVRGPADLPGLRQSFDFRLVGKLIINVGSPPECDDLRRARGRVLELREAQRVHPQIHREVDIPLTLVSDHFSRFTCIWTAEGLLYVAAVVDRLSLRVVGR
jgi:hypothetical protein